MRVYKVIYMVGSGQIVSKMGFWSAIAKGQSTVRYSLNKETKAPQTLAHFGYHLLAFDTRSAAVKFVGESVKVRWEGRKIYLAEATDRVSLPMFLHSTEQKYLFSCTGHHERETYFRSIQSNPRKEFGLGILDHPTWPKGTVMYKTIKLLEKVK